VKGGLSATAAAKALMEVGPNELARSEGASPWLLLLSQFKSALVALLVAATAVSLALGGACVPECPWAAIFPEDEVPAAFKAKGGEYLSQPVGTAGFDTVYDGHNHDGEAVHLEGTRVLAAGEVVDLTPDIAANAAFFKDGPGYSAAG